MKYIYQLAFLFFLLLPSQAAIDFDGVDDYLDAGDVTALNSASEFTISGWFLQDTLDQRRNMWAKSIDANSMIRARTWTDGRLYSYIEDNSDSTVSFDYSLYITAGQWHHYTWVFDGSLATSTDKFKVYIDGNLIATTAAGSAIAASTIDLTGYPLVIGQETYESDDDWNGDIDNFMVFDRALNATEVEALYNSRSKRVSGSLANGLVLHYEMDDKELGYRSGQAQDDSGNLNYGQFIGFTNVMDSFSNDVASLAPGNRSLAFTLGADHVEIPDAPNLDITNNAITLTAWINPVVGATSRQIIARSTGTATAQRQYAIYVGSAGGFGFETRTSSGRVDMRKGAITTGTWSHVAGIYNGSQMRWYLNNALIGTEPQAGNILSQSNDVYLGQFTGGISQYNGLMDDVRIYDRDLSLAELSFIYNGSGMDPGTSNLQALWTFDGDSVVKDSSGNDNHGLGSGGDSLQYIDSAINRF